MTKRKKGDVREDGYLFHGYTSSGYEDWRSPQSYHLSRLHHALSMARKRSNDQGLPFDLTVEHLAEVFPADNKCPALRIGMSWGLKDGRNNSPSLDRIIPELGYVCGNVQWLSMLANQIKTSATTEQVCAVADFLRRQSGRPGKISPT